MLPLLTQLNQWLGLFVPSLDQSRDAQHLSYNDLPEQTQIDALYLRQIRQRLEKGEKLRSEDTQKANELIKSFIENLTQTQQHGIAQIEAKFASSDERQKRTKEAIETKGAASWNRDKELPQEIVGSKNQLDHHEQLINVLGTELVNQREAREECDRQLTEMKGMLESLLRQVQGKGKQSDPTPERSIAAGGGDGGGNRPPPPKQGAPGAPGGGDSDDEGEGPRKGRRNERPARRSRKPRREEDEEDDDDEGMAGPDELSFSRILGRAIGDTSKHPAQPPPEYEDAKHQDVRLGLIACEDFFDRNPSQCRIEADRIKYALSKMKGPQVSSFAMNYRNQMIGELGFTRQEGYELWAIFAEQVVRRFGPTHKEVKVLREMMKVRYKGDIDQFPLEIENWNVKARVTGVGCRKMIDDQIPDEAVRRMSMMDPIADNREWLEAVRTASKAEEDFI